MKKQCNSGDSLSQDQCPHLGSDSDVEALGIRRASELVLRPRSAIASTLSAALAALAFLSSCSGLLAGERIAILGDIERNRAEVDMLTAQLSKEPEVELVERAEIDRIIAEQKLAKAGMSLESSLKLGAMLGAKGMVIVKDFEWEGRKILSARLVATESGAILGAWLQDTPSKEAEQFAAGVCFALEPLFKKLELDRSKMKAVSLLNIRAPLATQENLRLERECTLLLSQRLQQEKGFVLLERWRLSNVAWEKELNLDSNPLWTGSCMLDGSIESLQDGKDGVKAVLRLRWPDAKTELIELKGSASDLQGLVERMAVEVNGKLGLKTAAGAGSWDMSKEADFYLKEAEWLLRAGQFTRAREAADASTALGMKGQVLYRIRMKSFLEEITAKANYRTPDDMRQTQFATLECADLIIAALDAYNKHSIELYGVPPNSLLLEWSWKTDGNRIAEHAERLLGGIWAASRHLSSKEWKIRAETIRSLMMSCAPPGTGISLLYDNADESIAAYRKLLSAKFKGDNTKRMEIRKKLSIFSDPTMRINLWSISKEESQKISAERWRAFMKELNESGRKQDKIDALLLSGNSPEKTKAIDEFIWQERDSIFNGDTIYPQEDCSALLLGYLASSEMLKKILFYEFSRDCELNIEGVLSCFNAIENRDRNAKIKADYTQLREAWRSHWSKARRHYVAGSRNASSLDMLERSILGSKSGGAGSLAGKELDAEFSASLSSELREPMKKALMPILKEIGAAMQKEKGFSPYPAGLPNDSFSFSIDDLRIMDGQLCASGFGVASSLPLNHCAFLAAIENGKPNPGIKVFVSPETPPSVSPETLAVQGIVNTVGEGRNGGALCLGGGKVFHASNSGKIFVRDADAKSWTTLVESTGFKNVYSIAYSSGFLYVGYGAPWGSSGETATTGLVRIDTSSGAVSILASNKRNPPLSPLDNCRHWNAKAIACSQDGRTLATLIRMSEGGVNMPLYLLDLKDNAWSKAGSFAYGSVSLFDGDAINPIESKAQSLSLFDAEKGSLLKVNQGKLNAALNQEPQWKPYGTSWRVQNIAWTKEHMLKVVQTGDRLFSAALLDLKDGNVRTAKFKLSASALPEDAHFMRAIAFDGTKIALALGKPESSSESRSWRLLELPLNKIFHEQSEQLAISVDNDGMKASISGAAKGTELRYTLDGREPGRDSTLYSGEFEVQNQDIIQARAIMPDGTLGPVAKMAVLLPQSFEPLNSTPSSLAPGAICSIFNNAYARNPDFSGVEPDSSMKRDRLATPAIQLKASAGFRLSAFLKIEEEGLYSFKFNASGSDPNAAKVNPGFLVNGSRIHLSKDGAAQCCLTPGLYSLQVDFVTAIPLSSYSVSVKRPDSQAFGSMDEMIFCEEDSKHTVQQP